MGSAFSHEPAGTSHVNRMRASKASGAIVLARERTCNQVAFVHIPKCGGTTVVEAINNCGVRPCMLRPERSELFHEPAEAQRRRHAAVWSNAYTFSIVRNPYTWAVSQFFYNVEDHCTHDAKPACKYRAQLFNNGSSTYFYRPEHRQVFTAWLVEHDRNANRSRLPFMTPNLISREVHGRSTSQLAWISDRAGKLLIRRVVRIEDASDYAFHASCLGLHKIAFSEYNRSTDREGKAVSKTVKSTSHAASSAYYTATACEIVARRFKADFQAFGYDRTECPH